MTIDELTYRIGGIQIPKEYNAKDYLEMACWPLPYSTSADWTPRYPIFAPSCALKELRSPKA